MNLNKKPTPGGATTLRVVSVEWPGNIVVSDLNQRVTFLLPSAGLPFPPNCTVLAREPTTDTSVYDSDFAGAL